MRAPTAELLTEIILTVFRTNGRLLSSGDSLIAPFGLTSARWQVLGAVAMSDTPLSAPQIAAVMGTTRQGTQKQLNLLVEEGLLEQQSNPSHKRSPLYTLTKRGRSIYTDVDHTQARWANQLAEELSMDDLVATKRVLELVCERLERTSTRSNR
nr:helix-turn-helix domain-containing protein [Thiohalomonas denitrificans]